MIYVNFERILRIHLGLNFYFAQAKLPFKNKPKNRILLNFFEKKLKIKARNKAKFIYKIAF